jgi:hypothetical protein
MKALGLLAVVAVLCSCGSLGKSPIGLNSPQASAARTASAPRQGSPIPSLSPLPSLPPVALIPFPSCRLPYINGPAGSGAGNLAGGFVAGPQGVWTADPRGGITKSGNFYVTDVAPALKGSAFSSWDVGSYDLALNRWLPVRRSQVRGDGLAYAYAEPFRANASDPLENSTRIHIVSPVDGSDRVIYSGPPRTVVDYESDGIYVTAAAYYAGEGYGVGLWRLDPATGVATEIANGVPFEVLDRGIGWTDNGTIMTKSLIRFDLASGSQQEWGVNADSGWAALVGLDGTGDPLVDLHVFSTPASATLFVYTAPQSRRPIASVAFEALGVTDRHGTWLAGGDGIYLLDANDNLLKVSNETGGTVAGGCD